MALSDVCKALGGSFGVVHSKISVCGGLRSRGCHTRVLCKHDAEVLLKCDISVFGEQHLAIELIWVALSEDQAARSRRVELVMALSDVCEALGRSFRSFTFKFLTAATCVRAVAFDVTHDKKQSYGETQVLSLTAGVRAAGA